MIVRNGLTAVSQFINAAIARLGVGAVLLFALAAAAEAVPLLMMPDSTNNRLVILDAFDGSVVNSNYFALPDNTTPLAAIQAGNEIWVSHQIGDLVSRWSLTGAPLGQFGGGPAGGLDNIRGIAVINGALHVTNAGSDNGAPGASLVKFDSAGNNLGFLAMTDSSSPFDVIDYGGGLLVSSSSANDDIHRYTYAGVSAGTFHNSTSLNFVEQLHIATNGDVLAAGFSSDNVVRLNGSGSISSSFVASGARGVWELGNGNIMWTNGSGAHVYNVGAGTSSLVYAGEGRYLHLLDLEPASVPEPATLALLGLGLAGLGFSRRNQ